MKYNVPMTEQDYPDDVQRTMAEAERLLTDEEEADPCEAAAMCFDILALFPEHKGAHKLIQQAYRDGILLRDNRRALSRLIDEWDDRPWQQRRRLALSFGYVARWEEEYQDHLESFEEKSEEVEDVQKYLQTGDLQLLEDYLGGQSKGAEAAWQIFQEAIRLSKDAHATMFWVAKEYAQKGYFAESADVLDELLGQYPDDRSARRLWVEVRWWRDNQNHIPWIPPLGDGSRFRRMMMQNDPDGLAASESPENILNQYRSPKPGGLPPGMESLHHIPDHLNQKMNALFKSEQEPVSSHLVDDDPVDWSYLDAIERREIHPSKFPRWAREFLDDIDDLEERKYTEEMLLEQFSNMSLYDDAYFEEDDSDDDERVGDSQA